MDTKIILLNIYICMDGYKNTSNTTALCLVLEPKYISADIVSFSQSRIIICETYLIKTKVNKK